MTKLIRNIRKVFFFCLILFLVSSVASAESDHHSVLQYGLGNLDFESDSVGTAKYAVSRVNEYSVDRFGDKQGNHTALAVVQEHGNKYLSFKDNGAPILKPPYNPYWKIYTNKPLVKDDGYYVDGFSTAVYDFLVIDFELCADEYLYTYLKESGEVDMTTDELSIPNGAQIVSKRPAYPEGLLIMNEIAGIEYYGAQSQQKLANSIKLVSDGDEWYLHTEEEWGFENTGARLNSGIFEWNHFTVVLAISREDGNLANSVQYTYLNGDFVTKQSVGDIAQSFVDFSNLRYGIEIPYEAANDNRFLYSFGLDNFSINYYMRGSDGSAYYSSGYGLDDYFAENDETAGIYNCEDIVYSNSYRAVGVVASVDGVAYHSMSEALSAVTEGCTLKLYRSLDKYLPTVKGLTVIIDDSLNFSLSSEADGYICRDSLTDGLQTYQITYNEPEQGKEEEETDFLLRTRVFEGAKYSLSAVTNFVGNFYVKAPLRDAEYELYLGEGSGYTGLTYINGEPYYKFTSAPPVTDITAKISFNIKVITGGKEKTLSAEYTLDGYFSAAMANLSSINKPAEYQRLQMSLIMNAVRYANEIYKYANNSEIGYAKYEQILSDEAYSKYLTPYEELGVSENSESDLSEISSLVTGVGLVVGDGCGASLALYVKNELADTGRISVSYRSRTGEIKKSALSRVEPGDSADSGCCYLICQDLPIYEMLSCSIITVIGERGEVLTGIYTLGAYINSQGNAKSADLAKSAYAYAKSSYQYKISFE